MKFRNIFWGIILIFFGMLFTLENLHVLDFDWYNMWRLWPVIIILWGISILPVKDVIKIGLILIVLTGSIYYMLNDNVRWRFEEDNYTEMKSHAINQEFGVPYADSIRFASLDMEMAAGKFTLFQTSDQLLDFNKTGSLVRYKYIVKQEDTNTQVRIMMEDGVRLSSKQHNRVDLQLNANPVWDMDFEVGAADVNLDLTPFRVKSFAIEGGAAAIKIKLGELYPETYLDIEAGASNIELRIPESTGCELKISTVLSGRSISGFERVKHGLYRTDNFDEATNKIYMEVNAAVSSYSIVRY
jgi:hypothetical protein